jgi:hypothetical protein
MNEFSPRAGDTCLEIPKTADFYRVLFFHAAQWRRFCNAQKTPLRIRRVSLNASYSQHSTRHAQIASCVVPFGMT